ncbi:bifunctional demethylmenaquinone methyltransferase/2-methoxy-6-polyprenyl-1,4-benzoquinol methylase UbiE [uncultured Muribaculum sp.]|uniref:bifunctional demethylmenaquinone methyltransferase/2-methoxy-6-polyprenyl-1,4-benzoquinol methylase UbiE n=1 Tax=uncultured Muribaculum sp. TaxID=1918613 RepID=UPI002595F669|nr:bifunctional demethylmenaquinone methyltransferase/2-methoxy-6-polyprenyl-1,4-benzoquinol methylase UbiE [uncultured Muribaculum sp.]
MEVKAEKINPYDDSRCKTEQVREMFDSIAPAYDFMNRMMTFGIDKLWRLRAVNMLRRKSPQHILDVATGTGDLAMLMFKKLRPGRITGIDLSPGMIAVAEKKVAEAGLDGAIRFMNEDCLDLPFAPEVFDCITVAYGVRNFEHLDRGYAEMYRVMQRGGTLCVIELSTPRSPLVKPFYKFYTRHIIPWVGKAVSRDVRAYSYLPESIAAVPQGEEMLQLISEAGFKNCRCRRFTFGTCSVYLAEK